VRSGVCVLGVVGVMAATAIGQPSAPGPAAPKDSAPTKETWQQRRDRMAALAMGYLKSKQDGASGGWNVNPSGPTFTAITGLVVEGFLLEPGVDATDPAVAAGLKFMLSKQQADGGIYDRLLPTYNTAISLSALSQVKNPSQEIKDAIPRAQAFLKGLQYGEGASESGGAGAATVVGKDHAFYGGWGYGNRGRPDLSNSAFIIEALRVSGVPESDPAFQRALVFLQRTQMMEMGLEGTSINDMPYAKRSMQGGFIYSTSEDKDHVGVGQSFAGEMVESLSGPPGTSAQVVLKNGEDGKPLMLTREQIRERLKAQAEKASDSEAANAIGFAVIVFGPGSTSENANRFEVRTSLTRTAALEAVVNGAFADVTTQPAIVTPVRQWQGESRLRSYGSMTYSGFKSYIYAGLKRSDPRVQLARAWIGSNYTLEENPGVGTDGLYYYLLVFGKALRTYGETEMTITGRAGKPEVRDWRKDLVNRLAELQQPDGSFKSVDDRWMENDPVLITAYSLLALQQTR